MGPSILIGASLLFLFGVTDLLVNADDRTRTTIDLNTCLDCISNQQVMENTTSNSTLMVEETPGTVQSITFYIDIRVYKFEIVWNKWIIILLLCATSCADSDYRNVRTCEPWKMCALYIYMYNFVCEKSGKRCEKSGKHWINSGNREILRRFIFFLSIRA